jgi:5-(carboxyamino)imidazole ribonucleotide mutase
MRADDNDSHCSPLRPHDGVCCARDEVAGPYSAEAGARAGVRSARSRDGGMSEPSPGDQGREPQDPQDPSAREGLPTGAPGISLVPELMEEAEVQAQLDDIDVDAPRVGIVMGSKSDMEKMEQAANELEERGILHEVRVMSAHREADVVGEYAKNARMRGLRVIIAGAGISAALPGAVAAHTDLPVIGVPLSGRLSAAGGLDAILSIVQMPPGVPVACVGLDNARNAAILAARILGA